MKQTVFFLKSGVNIIHPVLLGELQFDVGDEEKHSKTERMVPRSCTQKTPAAFSSFSCPWGEKVFPIRLASQAPIKTSGRFN